MINNNLGINLNAINYWSTQLPFIDLIKSSDLLSTSGHNRITTGLDSNGWLTINPPAVPTFIMLRNNPLYNRTFIVSYEGEANIRYRFNVTKLPGSIQGRDIVRVNDSNGPGFWINFSNNNPNNYLRNIRVIPQEFEQQYASGEIFNPDWLSILQPFSTFRFMDWMKTNNSTVSSWNDRAKPDDAHYSDKGVPIEIIIRLCNEQNKHPWICIPHLADDNYVHNLATYIRNNLNPDLTPYFEYSNEVWNSIFAQAKYARSMGKAEGLNGLQYYAKRSVHVMEIVKSVLSNRKVNYVIGSQASNINASKVIIDYLKTTDKLHLFNCLAIAPYFGHYLGIPFYQEQVSKLSLDQLFTELRNGGILKRNGKIAVPGGAIKQSIGRVRNSLAIAKQNGLRLICYEGGQHLSAVGSVRNNHDIINLFIEANRHPLMGECYREYLGLWNLINPDLLCHFNDVRQHNRSGSWGMMESLGDTSSSKYKALLNPRV